jgi:hypothetical protein
MENYHIITFPGQSLSKTLEEAMDLSQDRLILELESGRGVKLTTHLHPMPRSRIVELHLHSTIHLHGIVFN